MNPRFLQRFFCFSKTCSHPVVFLERTGGKRVISSVTTMLSPIHYAGHQGPAKRFREATHHLTHVIPVHLERIPGKRANTVTHKYNHYIFKWGLIHFPVFSRSWTRAVCKHLRRGNYKESIQLHIQASFCTDSGCRWWLSFLLLMMRVWICTVNTTGWPLISYGI